MKTKLTIVLMILIMSGWNSFVKSTTYVITSTDADSLGQAIVDANGNAGPDTILFNIPDSDPGFNETTGVWTIKPVGVSYIIDGDSIVIDGTSQTKNLGDRNPHGPEIEIDGSEGESNGFDISGPANTIKGLIINRFPWWGVIIGSEYAIGNTIAGNYIGTDYTGDTALGNAYGGIYISFGPSKNLIGGMIPEDRNIISGASYEGNVNHGNGIIIISSDSNVLYGNYIGTNRDGTSVLGNLKAGIVIRYSANNIVGGLEPGQGNLISGNGWCGVCIRTSENTTVAGNYIGTDITGLESLGNATLYQHGNGGVILDFGAQDNSIGPGNVIAFNAEIGVRVRHDSTIANTISQNSITHHSEYGIFLDQGGNESISAPVINEFTTQFVAGTTIPDAIVEIFSDSADEARIYEGTVNSDEAGNFKWEGLAGGPNVTATVTDTNSNTSQISVPYTPNVEYRRDLKISEGSYLHQNFPNPFHSKTTIAFSLPKPERITLKVYDGQGRIVTHLASGLFQPGYHEITWDATAYPAGVYVYQLETATHTDDRMLILRK